MPAVIHDMRDASVPFPDFIILDTSVILEIFSPPGLHAHHNVAINFLNRLRQAAYQGKVIPLLPDLVLEEFFFKLIVRAMESVARQQGVPWHRYYKQDPQFIQTIHPRLVQNYQQIQAFPMMILTPEDLRIESENHVQSLVDRMLELIGEFSVLPKDAFILSEAERLGISTLATLDDDWERADGFEIFAPV